jgi:ABC-2 type transport system ATP-binding protein
MSEPFAIETSQLTKSFGPVRALDGVDLTVAAGGVYGVLGPNGAGKTTTIRVLATLLRPDSGSARVFGRDVVSDSEEVRAQVRLAGQSASVDEDLTGFENLVLVGRLLGCGRRQARDRADQLLAWFGLNGAAGRPVRTWSGGMRHRLELASSVVVAPALLFLDEPTTGLDPWSRNQIWDMVRGLVSEGTTVLLTTQYLEEADRLAERVAVIDHGRVIAEGPPGELKASLGASVLRIRLRQLEDRRAAERLLSSRFGATIRPSSDPAVVSVVASAPDRAADAVAAVTREGVPVVEFALDPPTLDEVFLSITGHSQAAPSTTPEVRS